MKEGKKGHLETEGRKERRNGRQRKTEKGNKTKHRHRKGGE